MFNQAFSLLSLYPLGNQHRLGCIFVTYMSAVKKPILPTILYLKYLN